MLRLLNSPVWAVEGAAPCPLPLTLPGALLAVLATHEDWLSRGELALIFWPDATREEALHRLRINLHRSRALLASWGQREALEVDRQRLRLSLPTDLAQLRAAQAQPALQDGRGLAQFRGPAKWLAAWRLPACEGFTQWCDETALKLQTDWLTAHRNDPRTAPTTSSTTSTTTANASASAWPSLPGRAAELHRVLTSPMPAMVLLGEPGAGKTTLMLAAHPHAPCLRGLEGLHALPYRPLLDALREHLPMVARAAREPGHPLRPYRLDLARVLPELAPDEALPPLDALTAQTRLFEALARAFEALTPLLLIDDLQWCDPATVQWLAMLAYSGRLRWRATARTHEINSNLAQSLRALVAAARLEELALAALGRTALEQVCRSRWPDQRFSAARLDQLHDLSGGNAFVLTELVAVNLTEDDNAPPDSHLLRALDRVRPMVQRRLKTLPPLARRMVEAAAIFAQHVPATALQVNFASASQAQVESQAQPSEAQWLQACDSALAAGLLRSEVPGLACRHDLVRHAVACGLPASERTALHRHAALWLATQGELDALTIAEHWNAANEPQTALAWRHRAGRQLKARGHFDEARRMWREVVDSSLEVSLRLRSQLDLAACDLYDNLARGEAALQAVCAQLNAVADTEQRLHIEADALAARVDNRVFAGDVPAACLHAARLRSLLPQLRPAEAVNAIEVLIELAMRQPDIAAAWALLGQLRELEPQRPTLLSYEGQIHWFGGQVQAAHDVFARMLELYPDYCRGITIENDLAVMLQALGRIEEAEAMAQRSLQNWVGVAHTETLSLLVLGLISTSAGRHAQADATLQRALVMACEQGSPGFESEALVRRARMLLQCGQIAAAQQALQRAAPLLIDSPEPMRISQLVLMQMLCASAAGAQPPAGAMQRLRKVARSSEHPLVHVRLARVQNELAAMQADWPRAAAAAAEMAKQARSGGLLESLAEALLLQARAGLASTPSATAHAETRHPTALAQQAWELAKRHGFADVRWRAASWLQAHGGEFTPVDGAAQVAEALVCLQGSTLPMLFDAAAAARREPCW